MFAVFKAGGKQYRANAGSVLSVNKIEGEAGSKVVFDDVIAAGESVTSLDKAKVEAEIVEQYKDKKVLVFKKKRRHNYRRKIGHRQLLTKLRILSVTDAAGNEHKAEVKAKAPKKAETKKAEPKKAAEKKTTTKTAATAEAKKEN